MNAAPLKLSVLAVILLAGQALAAPQGDAYAEYPNGAFNDRVPNNENNQQFKEYADFLTRFDEWVTGKKVPIPADPVTDALHQNLPPDAPTFGQVRVARNTVHKREDKPDESLISKDKDFGEHIEDKVPETTTSSDPKYGDFIKELKRFDPYLIGRNVTIPHNATADRVWNSKEAGQH
ncbi:uncharacterized protein LOC118510388 isoform X2 [Anopheles stephensi]|uniref:uncharacterized protein LOC118510388 isoform X2 n=1 Tax=Anopheles stephensi TaxID=30069 RepID=UPI001658B6F0|nr:uncharacterized protein LOC118510388 isoform X2 [Anopheles stephensi]